MNETEPVQVDNNCLFECPSDSVEPSKCLNIVYKQFLSKIKETLPDYLIKVYKSSNQIIVQYKTGYKEDIVELIGPCTDREGGGLFCLQQVNEINIVSSNTLSLSNICFATLTCFAQDQHQRNFVITAKNVFSPFKKKESKLSFNGGVLHFRPNSSIDQYIHCSVCYGIHKGCRLGESKIKVQIDIAVTLLPYIELSKMAKLDVFENDVNTASCDDSDSEDDCYDGCDDTENDDINELDGSLVEKTGAATGLTRGIIYNSDYSFKDKRGLFSVLFAEENDGCYQVNSDKPFASYGDSGALVKLVQKDKKIGLGIVYCSSETFTKELKWMTFCIKLDNCLTALRERWGLKLTLYENPVIRALKTENRKRFKSQ